MNDRRSIERAKNYKGALMLFRGQVGMHSCGVMDIAPIGACIRTQNLPVMPIDFELSFDNFQTVHRCRMIWRDGDFVGVAFEN